MDRVAGRQRQQLQNRGWALPAAELLDLAAADVYAQTAQQSDAQVVCSVHFNLP